MMHSGRDTASSRLQGYHVHDYLQRTGWGSHLVLAPKVMIADSDLPLEYSDTLAFGRVGDIVVLQKLHGPHTRSWIRGLRRRGLRTILVDCDLPLKRAEAALVDCVVTPSEPLRAAYEEAGVRLAVRVPDAAERFAQPEFRPRADRQRRCVWFGNWLPSRGADIDFARALVDKVPNLELTVISTDAHADVKWDRTTFFDVLREFDFSLLPIVNHESPEAAVKSANRATQSMALGVPVLTSPIASYVEVIENGTNGFLCTAPEHWSSAIEAMMNERLRFDIASSAVAYAAAHCSIENTGRRWEELLCTLGTDVRSKWHPTRTGRRDVARAREQLARALVS